MHSTPWGVTLLEEVLTREANRAENERLHALRQRWWLLSAVWAWGEESPSESGSLGDEDEAEDESEEEGG
jgi:hypothetical protein